MDDFVKAVGWRRYKTNDMKSEIEILFVKKMNFS